MTEVGLQDRYAPHSRCFGCGPANDKGLRIKSRIAEGQDDRGGASTAPLDLVCDFTPEPHHEAFPGMVNGGIIGALLDCHSNWTAAFHLMRVRGMESPPCTVTADFHVKLKKPTPMGPLRLRAQVVEVDQDKVSIEATLEAGGRVTATCRGTFVAVKEGHPAYHRW